MSAQREFFSRGNKRSDPKIARQTWIERTKEETIVKVLMDGLTAARIPVMRVRERISNCHRCHAFIGQPSQAGIPDLVGWIPGALLPGIPDEQRDLLARPLFIEVKRPKGGIESAVQKEFIDRAKRGGAVAFFARGWDECAAQLEAAGVKLPF